MQLLKIIFIPCLLAFGFGISQQAGAQFDPSDSGQRLGNWQSTYIGRAYIQGINAIASLDQTSDNETSQITPGFKINSVASEQMHYRLALHIEDQPELVLFFSTNKEEKTVDGHKLLRFTSQDQSTSPISFVIMGEEGNTLTVNYLRHEGQNVVERGSFVINPAITTESDNSF